MGISCCRNRCRKNGAPPFSWQRANPIGSLRLLRSHPSLLGLATVIFLDHLAHMVLPSVFVFYAGYRYGWDARRRGARAWRRSACAQRSCKADSCGPSSTGSASGGPSLPDRCSVPQASSLYGYAPTETAFIMAIPVMAYGASPIRRRKSIMTRLVSTSEQGQLQGATSSLTAIAVADRAGTFHADIRVFHFRGGRPPVPGAPSIFRR